MQKLYVIAVICLAFLLNSCSGSKVEADYPLEPDQARRARHGKITGESGIVIFGGDKKSSGSGAIGAGIGVNSYLWRAALDTLSFMPLASADPFGGLIITDWYENPEVGEEKFKINVYILGSELKTNALKVTVFKKVKTSDDTWQDAPVSNKVARELEDKILTRARELRVRQE